MVLKLEAVQSPCLSLAFLECRGPCSLGTEEAQGAQIRFDADMKRPWAKNQRIQNMGCVFLSHTYRWYDPQIIMRYLRADEAGTECKEGVSMEKQGVKVCPPLPQVPLLVS